MTAYTIRKPEKKLLGEITLAGSKSISNRALIIQALCEDDFEISALANAKDTDLIQALLASNDPVRDAGAAGTTFRFMTAYLAMQDGEQILTGTERMKQRPIGVLVDALRKLGANIEYLEKEGYPPLKIGPLSNEVSVNKLSISASTSSQYISALLMIAPTLPKGLELTLEGKIVSRSYIEMTLNLMEYFGIKYDWKENVIIVPPQKYTARPYTVEADWSAASYYYGMAALADEVDLQLNGLFPKSVQGDAVLSQMMEHFGIHTTFNEGGIHLKKTTQGQVPEFKWDFIQCPDVAQTLAVVCAGVGTRGIFTGLDTLSIKETDRIKALEDELSKVGAYFLPAERTDDMLPEKKYFEVKGKAKVNKKPVFATYEDHRMAMAFAPLAMLGEIIIEEPSVVEKSYPDFWQDLELLGFEIN